MGEPLNETSRVRAALAVGLLVLATAGPLIKWYFAGREAADREGSRIEARARARETTMATQFASAAGARLEQLRETESLQPWAPELGAPDAQRSPDDPLVACRFVVSETGLRSLNSRDGSPQLGPNEATILREAASHCVSGETTSADPPVFEWRTVRFGAARHLAALRCIIRPSGRVVQGFLVDPRAFEPMMRDVAAHLGPGTPSVSATRLPLAGGSWAVRVGNTDLMAEAAEHAELVRARFQQTFLLSAALALLAASAGVGLVLRSQTASRRRSELAAAAAHELRTPLASIRLHAELAEAAPDGDAARRHARIVALEAERLGRVVANVLSFARLESGAKARAPEPCCPDTIVRECFDRQRELLEARGMILELDVQEGLPTVLADADSVAEILSNLLDNAERHSRGAVERLARVEVRLSPREGSGVDVSVIDSGDGIPDGLLASGFHAFRRGEASSGLGLGLAISSALARAMGGSLVLARGPMKGTIARLTLRLA